MKTTLSFTALESLKNIAKRWSQIKPKSSYASNFELVWDKIKDFSDRLTLKDAKWPAHQACRRNFTNEQKLTTNSRQPIDKTGGGENTDTPNNEPNYVDSIASKKVSLLKSREEMDFNVCFCCKERDRKYTNYETIRDTLQRVELDSGANTLKRAMERHVESNDPWFAAAAKRLKVITVNQDTFSADVVYHQKCYNKFTEEYEKVVK